MSFNTLSGIGCIEQYQFCHINQCTPLTGIHLIDQRTVDTLGLNLRQAATLQLLLKVALWMRMKVMLAFLGSDILLAKGRLFGGFWLSPALENDQWQNEVENIHNTSMAFLQQRIIDYTSPFNSRIHQSVKLQDYIMQENGYEAQYLCTNQKTRSTIHCSLNGVGLFLIILGGTFIVLVNVLIPHLMGWLQRRSEKGEAARLDWIESEPLQLQRVAFEARGIEPWKGKDVSVPVTAKFGQSFEA
jgi:hypothetical protein